MRKLAWIVGTVAVLAIAGMLLTDSDDEPAADAEQVADSTDPEQQYLDNIRDETPALNGFDDKTLLDLGHAVCDDIDNGMTPTDVNISIEDQGGPYEDAASSIVGEAQIHLCL